MGLTEVGVKQGGEHNVCSLSIQTRHLDGAYGGVVHAQVHRQERDQGDPCCGVAGDMRYHKGPDLRLH